MTVLRLTSWGMGLEHHKSKGNNLKHKRKFTNNKSWICLDWINRVFLNKNSRNNSVANNNKGNNHINNKKFNNNNLII